MDERPASTLSVRDVLATPVLRAAGPEVVAGHDGLAGRVRWVHSAELADIAPLLRPDDLLLSTGIAMPDTPAELAEFASSLADTGASGIVIELGRRWQRIPQSLITACDNLGLPLVALRQEARFAAIIQDVGERLVASQIAELREAQRVHETFTELSVAEAGPRDILEAVQRLSGSTVVLENENHQILDFRSGTDDPADMLLNWGPSSRRLQVHGRTSWDADGGWLISRVGRRERRWGRLLIRATQPPPGRLFAVIERAAAALAMDRLHARQQDSVVRRTHHELIVGLLSDPRSPDLAKRCELAEFPVERRQFVGVTINPRPNPGENISRTPDVDELVAAAVHAAHEQRTPALVCEVDSDVRLLLSLDAGAQVAPIVTAITRALEHRGRIVAGAGRPVPRLTQADRTLRESHQVVQAVRGDSAGVHWLEDVHLRGLLALLAEDDRLGLFVDRELAALRDYDASHGTDLEAAVRALLEHPTSKVAAAAALHLSRPVFYDRIAKAERVLGVDVDDPHIRASLHVAMLAAELTPP
ncbi:PucR family transcriptional regulator [Demetria terragena]|uniref:PucR family transcriptional regulator n=1 Tax=Demetria terragena TaxID=63959 RepID=UPI0003815795|nr:PucR family transcriptional regulator [Demetria terragena]